MSSFNIIITATLLLGFCITYSENRVLNTFDDSECELLANPSGILNFDETVSRYSSGRKKCWRVRVPENSFTAVDVETFTISNYDCSYFYIEVFQTKPKLNRDDSFQRSIKYCPKEARWNTFMAVENFTVYLHKTFTNYDSRIRLTLKYRSENILCAKSDSFKCPDGSCVPGNKVCDEIKDCIDGSDEFGCLTGVFAAEGISYSREGSIKWMKKGWSLGSGWKDKTQSATIALSLATDGNFTESETEKELVVKQLEVGALAALLRNASDEVTVNQLSMFVNALLVTCQNPRNFHGFDFLTLLKEKTLVSSTMTSIPMAYLALCNAKASLPNNATKILNGVLTSEANYPFMIDIQAVSVMALSCLQDQQTEGGDNKSEELLTAIHKMKQLQREDGSFGTIYSTAIITQALLSSGQERSTDWSVKSAVTHLIKHLNSSEVDIMSTTLILPILNKKSMYDIRKTNCTGNVRFRSGESGMKDKLGPKMRVRYSLYIGDEKDVIHTISLRVPQNVTAFDVMSLAKEEDIKYDFKWKEMKSSKYVYEIAGKTNDFEENQFWFLYLGKGENDIVHSTESPDRSVLHDGDHMIMWYKMAEISPSL